MSDVFGNALERLSLAEPGVVPAVSEKSVFTDTLPAKSCAGDSDSALLPESDFESDSESEALNEPTNAPVGGDVGVSAATVTPRLSPEWLRSVALLSGSTVGFILEHRRQTAAAVVLLCMTWVWFERSSEATATTAAAPDPGLTDVESILSEFDAGSAEHLREPAEPIESVAYGSGLLTFPQEGVQSPGNLADASNVPPSSAATAVYPDQQAGTSSPAGSQQTPMTSGTVRFTGQIQPLN